jgi:hypothetical protein
MNYNIGQVRIKEERQKEVNHPITLYEKVDWEDIRAMKFFMNTRTLC